MRDELEALFDRLVDELGNGLDVAVDLGSGEVEFVDTCDLTTWRLRLLT